VKKNARKKGGGARKEEKSGHVHGGGEWKRKPELGIRPPEKHNCSFPIGGL